MVNSINFLKYLEEYYKISKKEYSWHNMIFIFIPLILSFILYFLLDLKFIQAFFRDLTTYFAILITLAISILVYIINVNNLNFLGEDNKSERIKNKLIIFKKKFALALFTLIIWGTILILLTSIFINLNVKNSLFNDYLISCYSIILLFLFFHIIMILFNIYRLLGYLMNFNFIIEKKKK